MIPVSFFSSNSESSSQFGNLLKRSTIRKVFIKLALLNVSLIIVDVDSILDDGLLRNSGLNILVYGAKPILPSALPFSLGNVAWNAPLNWQFSIALFLLKADLRIVLTFIGGHGRLPSRFVSLSLQVLLCFLSIVQPLLDVVVGQIHIPIGFLQLVKKVLPLVLWIDDLLDYLSGLDNLELLCCGGAVSHSDEIPKQSFPAHNFVVASFEKESRLRLVALILILRCSTFRKS